MESPSRGLWASIERLSNQLLVTPHSALLLQNSNGRSAFLLKATIDSQLKSYRQ
jgi:hypothetical protein